MPKASPAVSAAEVPAQPSEAADKVRFEALPPEPQPAPGSEAPEGGVIVAEPGPGTPGEPQETLTPGIRRIDF